MPAVLTEDDLRDTGLTPEEVRREVAVWLFAQDRLTLGQAARLAGMAQEPFMVLLAQRRIPLHYGVEDLEQDLKTLDSLPRPGGALRGPS